VYKKEKVVSAYFPSGCHNHTNKKAQAGGLSKRKTMRRKKKGISGKKVEKKNRAME